MERRLEANSLPQVFGVLAQLCDDKVHGILNWRQGVVDTKLQNFQNCNLKRLLGIVNVI